MNKSIVDKKILSKLNKAKDSEWHKIYFNEVRPVITGALKSKIEKEKLNGAFPVYKNLVLILHHNVNPSLIIAQAINAEKTIILFTEKNRKQLEKAFLPAINEEMPHAAIEFLELDYNDHDYNYNRIYETLKEIDDKSGTLCDITGGKKIISAHLGIIANNLGMDICYIDSSDLLNNSSVPEPGSESLYIHYSGNERIHEISLRDQNMLVIHSVDNSTITFDYHTNGECLFFKKGGLIPSKVKALSTEIETACRRIDHGIECEKNCLKEIDEITGLVRSMLIENDLDTALHAAVNSNIKLVVDPEVAGIPWELLLTRGYRFTDPVISKMTRDNKIGLSSSEDKNGILFIKGSGAGIENFEGAVSEVISILDASGKKYKSVDAEDAGIVSSELGRRRYNIIIYFGHSDFEEDPSKTGWRCINGEIFSCKEFSILSHNAPDMIISNSCNSARAIPFVSHSIAYYALRAGAKSYIGTRWLLEFERSGRFINALIRNMLQRHKSPEESFTAAINFMKKEYGSDDTSVYNYIFYN